jgi:SAM-dependent methyltransferase
MSASPAFKDHFSKQAADYTRYRPGYPPELFAWLAGLTAGHDTAWDCGCGNGQASLGLTPYFQRVLATDPSKQQIDNAHPHERINYSVGTAEESGLEADSIDLVLVAQALHWFDFDRFYAEVRRVIRPGGVLAAVSYGELRVEGAPDTVVAHFYHRIIGPYWPPERKYVDEGYCSIPFPFPRIDAPPFAMQADWNLEQLLGYLGTWSAVKEYKQHNGNDPRELIANDLRNAWGDPDLTRRINWPLTLLVGRAKE